MPISWHDHWILLRFQIDSRHIWVTYQDDRGNHREPAPTSSGFKAEDWLRPQGPAGSPPGLISQWLPDFQVSPDLDILVANTLELVLPNRFGPHVNGPVPLAVFLDPPAHLRFLPWEELVAPLLKIEPERLQLVRLASEGWSERSPFRLPLTVLATGVPCYRMLNRLREAKWYRDTIEVQTHGLRMDFVEPERIDHALRSDPRHIVLADNDCIEAVSTAIARVAGTPELLPRLVVYLDVTRNALYSIALPLPSGVSLLWIPQAFDDVPATEQWLHDLVFGIIHDYPLHEAVKSAQRGALTANWAIPVLISDPAGIHALRMASAFEQLQREASGFDRAFAAGNLLGFLERVAPGGLPGLGPRLASAMTLDSLVSAVASSARSLDANFQQESFGLAPLAASEVALSGARRARADLHATLSGLATEAGFIDALRRGQQRVVDVGMDEYDRQGSVFRAMGPNRLLVLGEEYRVNVHIGHRDPHRSLVVGNPAPIDPLLPELEEREVYQLEIALFQKDFILASKPVCPIRLPRFGGSEIAQFHVVAPSHTGTAELRIGIFHENHLLQSFVLKGLVSEAAGWGPTQMLSVALDFATTAAFGNLDDLKTRAFSIGVNQDGDGATHSFFLKGDGAAQGIRMTEQEIVKRTGRFRELVEQATYRSNNEARFETDPPAGSPPSADFQQVVADLAEFGRDAYRLIFGQANDELRQRLDKLRTTTDKSIQIILHNENFAFPWAAVYDYSLPVRAFGSAPFPICLGQPLTAPDPSLVSAQHLGCPHNPGRAVYCIEGFWGVRHRIEQLTRPSAASADTIPWIVTPKERARALFAAGIDDLPTQALRTRLQAELGHALVDLKPEDDLLDILWRESDRPAVLIVVGHLKTAETNGEPAGPRIIPFPPAKWTDSGPIPVERWVQDQVVAERVTNAKAWQGQPHTLVLLMACSAAALEVGTLGHLVKSFGSAGASAIVGTECAAFSALVARFSREVIHDLWGEGRSLGQAIREFTERLMRAGNPLGLVFTCYGSTDLTLLPGGAP